MGDELRFQWGFNNVPPIGGQATIPIKKSQSLEEARANVKRLEKAAKVRKQNEKTAKKQARIRREAQKELIRLSKGNGKAAVMAAKVLAH